ncbi:MAG: hypothetical protein Q8Q96_00005 [bacterium]|nr:hypothetical protein [bacterium]
MREFFESTPEEVFHVLSGECSSLDGFDGDYRRRVVENADPTVLQKMAKEIRLGVTGKTTGRCELLKEIGTRLRIEGKI